LEYVGGRGHTEFAAVYAKSAVAVGRALEASAGLVLSASVVCEDVDDSVPPEAAGRATEAGATSGVGAGTIVGPEAASGAAATTGALTDVAVVAPAGVVAVGAGCAASLGEPPPPPLPMRRARWMRRSSPCVQ